MNETPAIPAATVVLVRDAVDGVEVLTVHRTSKVHFGGMWVFPGGRIDPADHPEDGDLDVAARNAAARETREETGINVAADTFVYFSHWTPPPTTPRRYSTWFFAAALNEDQEINVDGHEIQDHRWIKPAEVLVQHARGEVDLAPPTWITLYHLSRYAPADNLLSVLDDIPVRFYETRIAQRADGVRVAMWHGDAGYDTIDADTDGTRHRLVMKEDGFEFEHADGDY